MTNQEIFRHIDHTLLKPTATWTDIQKLCDEAVAYQTASVCIPPSYVLRAHETYPLLRICTVVGFPLGYSVTPIKVWEAEEAIEDGASEIDMVVNIGDVKNHAFRQVQNEIECLRNIVRSKILKVIIETCYLTEPEKIELCEIITDVGADYIKTSTGFGTAGAALVDILLFKEHIGPEVKIKAAGGVKTRADLEMFLNAGCDRIGTSSAVALLAGNSGSGY